jgi:hypothetical protein
VPRCPVEGHEDSHVVLGGRYGKPGRQRQLYVCDQPKPGSSGPTHRFTAPLPSHDPGPATVERTIDLGEDLRAARQYQFTAYDVANALVAVSRGASYAQAGQNVREHAAVRWGAAEGREGRRHGTLVSDWVEVYAEALWQAQNPYRNVWPETVLVAHLSVVVKDSLLFSVLVASTYDDDGDWRIFAVRTSAGTSTRHWAEFLGELAGARPGAPAWIVGDNSLAFRRAVAQVWPAGSGAVTGLPRLWWDEHHMRSKAQQILHHRGLDQRGSSLWMLLLRAWRSEADWAAFRVEADRYQLPELERWLRAAAPAMALQFAHRTPKQRRSRVRTLAALAELDVRIGARRMTFSNRARTDRLLQLMALDLSARSGVNVWAAVICEWLERGNGRPASTQRRIADRAGGPSLRSVRRTPA